MHNLIVKTVSLFLVPKAWCGSPSGRLEKTEPAAARVFDRLAEELPQDHPNVDSTTLLVHRRLAGSASSGDLVRARYSSGAFYILEPDSDQKTSTTCNTSSELNDLNLARIEELWQTSNSIAITVQAISFSGHCSLSPKDPTNPLEWLNVLHQTTSNN
ncbi:hypothetical protein B0H14DRAFT_2566786 [Mycena olivaceomarginata]|nr:hypothetical protein B0H14DRAFT_2566786 [Mycena olivaceomarginata]